MPRLLKDLHIDDVSSVTAGEGRGVKVLLMKSNTQEDSVQVLNIEDVRKAHSDGRMSNSNVFKLFNDTLRKLQVEGESEGETLSRCTNWRDVRYNKKFHYLFDFVNELERVGKAAPANGPYGHGTVTSNSRSFDANSDEGEKIRERGITDQHGQPLADNDFATQLAGVPKEKRLKITEHAARHNMSLKAAKAAVMG